MSGYANPDRPDLRLSDAERDEAVGQLADARTVGRLVPGARERGAVSRHQGRPHAALRGFAWSWLWFFLIPVVAIIIYGPGGGGRGSRD
ncbi:hypothetical protein [Agromyces bauzanensis]|uniref:Uncharacterized protein n=1 Tax=Agromyces bauzanensis TaxID=1308924 RepID=A0A917PQA6_9MICO|nr:hypothetical protein [Agromyces bauzanensis]GGJ87166.1 hypothetical protein GCM10011372_27060 [Agromyces bauzanensis]